MQLQALKVRSTLFLGCYNVRRPRRIGLGGAVSTRGRLSKRPQGSDNIAACLSCLHWSCFFVFLSLFLSSVFCLLVLVFLSLFLYWVFFLFGKECLCSCLPVRKCSCVFVFVFCLLSLLLAFVFLSSCPEVLLVFVAFLVVFLGSY